MPHLPLKDFFNLLCSLKNAAGWVQEPKGRALIKFLAEKTAISWVAVDRKLNTLSELKYVEKEFSGQRKRILWRVKILTDSWDETRLTGKSSREGVALEARQDKQVAEVPAAKTLLESAKTAREKRFAIFMDFVNLERNLPKTTDRFRDFSWLLDPVLKQGKIIFAFVFIPDHYVARAPIMQLTHKHHFYAIFCPRKISGTITKDSDTVDAQMQELAWALIEHSNITDVVIITGDADFQRLATQARWQQKRVAVVSTEKALSSRFLEMEQDGSLAIQLVS